MYHVSMIRVGNEATLQLTSKLDAVSRIDQNILFACHDQGRNTTTDTNKHRTFAPGKRHKCSTSHLSLSLARRRGLHR